MRIWETRRVGRMRETSCQPLASSALVSGDCIDDAHAFRAGGTKQVLGYAVKARPTLGTFLRSFGRGHVRELDWMSRELLAQAQAAGAGPGASWVPAGAILR